MFSHCPFNTVAVQIRAFLIVVNVFTTLINDGQRLMNQIEKAGKHPERRGQFLIADAIHAFLISIVHVVIIKVTNFRRCDE